MIRRKVFSSYSEEDLINAIEERAFCEGYIAAQKEFGWTAADAVRNFKLGNQLEIARAQELERMLKRPSLKSSLKNIKNNTKRLLGLG